MRLSLPVHTIRYDTIGEFNVDWKAEYSALSITRSQKKKLKKKKTKINYICYIYSLMTTG